MPTAMPSLLQVFYRKMVDDKLLLVKQSTGASD
jgi:hypothetical protein